MRGPSRSRARAVQSAAARVWGRVLAAARVWGWVPEAVVCRGTPEAAVHAEVTVAAVAVASAAALPLMNVRRSMGPPGGSVWCRVVPFSLN